MTNLENEVFEANNQAPIAHDVTSTTFCIRALADIKEPTTDAEDPDCLFQNRWLRKGNCGFIISSAGIGKSSFAMQAAVHWGKGEEMLGIRPTKPLKTLIVQAEDDDYDISIFRRGTRIGLATELNWDNSTIKKAESNVLVGTISGVTNDEFFKVLYDAIHKAHPDLVIINPLHAFFDGNLSESRACSEFLRKGLDPIIKGSETKCGALIIHHTGKPKETSGNLSAAYIGNGSAELTNYPRSTLTITPHSHIRGVFLLKGAKHGDRLDWRDQNGRLTDTKVICYANKLPRYDNKGRVIYWVEPTPAELLALSSPKRGVTDDKLHTTSQQKIDNDKGVDANALSLVEYVKAQPSNTIINQNLREYSSQKWQTQAARKAVKQFESIRRNYGIEKNGKYYTHNNLITLATS